MNNHVNNNEKFSQWISSVKTQEPDSLDRAISAGIRKSKKLKARASLLRSSIAAVLVLLIGFSVLVNTSYAFAQSIMKIPPLRAIAKLVAMDPTLKIALENDYVQLIGETIETENGYLALNYIIADAQQITVFVTEKNIKFDHCLILDRKTNQEILCSTGMTRYVADSSKPEMFGITYDIADGYELSDKIRLDYVFEGSSKKYSCNVDLDKKFRNNLQDYKINKTIDVEGQKIALDKIRISPTKARLFMKVDPKNSCYIKNLTIMLKDEKGKTWNTESNGISGYFNIEGTDLESVMLESTYFNKPKHLSLEISGYEPVLKMESKAVFDYEKHTFESLPAYVTLKEVSSDNGKLLLTISAHLGQADKFGQLFSFEYFDSDGKRHELHSQGKTFSPADGLLTEFSLEIEDLKTGKAIFSIGNSPSKKILPVLIPIY